MQNMGGGDCPFEFNFEPSTFKVGDVVSFRIPKHFGEMPFVGTLLSVHDDYVELTSDPNDPNERLRATKESRPIVEHWEAA